MLKSAGYSFLEAECHAVNRQKYDEQLAILKSRGLKIVDEAAALKILQHHNYYRLSAYRFPLTYRGNPDCFLPDATFDGLWQLYQFDHTLRVLVTEATRLVEISVRSNWAYVLGHELGPQSFEDPKNFVQPREHNGKWFDLHADALEKLDKDLERSKEVFVQHFGMKYQMKRPPIWAVCEVASFGTISKLYAGIGSIRTKKMISTVYGLSPELLESVLEHLVYIRNLCAHHSRLWNRGLTLTYELPKSSPKELIPNLNNLPENDQKRRLIYNTLVMLIYLVRQIEPSSLWPKKLADHVSTMRSEFFANMGFPPDWRTRPYWSLPSSAMPSSVEDPAS